MSRIRFTLGMLALALTAACSGSDAPEPGPSAGASTAPAAPPPAPLPINLTGVTLPEGVTPAMAQAGAALFPTQVCTACHGPNAQGLAGLGPNLTDATWINSDGSYDAIVNTITNGIPTPREHPGLMPPKGGNPAITDQQVRELAAAIFVLSHSQ